MKKFIIPILFLFPFSAFAQPVLPLSVSFNPNPLFNASNFIPGDEKTADITISNGSDASQSAYIKAVNISNADNLASQMWLQIFEDSTRIYDSNFETFLTAGPVLLSSINAGGSKTYTLKAVFLDNAGDNYQGKTLGFDICVGFSGGNETCTNETVISGENNSGGGGGSGGGGEGGSHLLIFNEKNEVPVPETTTVAVYWQTNKPATGQIIYGLAENNYVLDLNNLPYFGYPMGTVENLAKVTNHAMVMIGLIPGQAYKYRVVSRASPPTISYEHEFKVPISGSLGISGGTGHGSGSVAGEILGVSSENNGNSTKSTSDGNNLATAFAAGWGGLFSWWWLWLLLIILIYFVWRFISGKRDEN